jgi:hypothetical protein
VKDVEGPALPGGLVNRIKDSGDMVTLIQRLAYLVRVAFGQHLTYRC